MSPGEIALLVGLIANAVAIICAATINYRSNKKIIANIEVVHHATNSMKDELVDEVRASSLAKGLKQGRAMKKDKPVKKSTRT